MKKLADLGRYFYGTAIAGMGIQTVYYHDLPYMLFPATPAQGPGLTVTTYFFGIMFILAGTSVLFKKKTRPVCLLFGATLLLIFCLYYIPFQFLKNPNFMHLIEWDNAGKEWALSSGAFIVAGCFPATKENSFFRLLAKLIPLGTKFFAITILCFGILHFLYASGVTEYIPLWIPHKIFWAYLAGLGLFGSSVGILLKIWPDLMAVLLGTMIFTWFVILHIPKVIYSTGDAREGEITSAFLALAYSGTAFVIASVGKNKSSIREKDVSEV
jgi:uncharacterized membrane protein YphA (DoxX/SURF4 family)